MTTELVKLIDNEPKVSTLDMWEDLKVEHNAIIKLIRNDWHNNLHSIKHLTRRQ